MGLVDGYKPLTAMGRLRLFTLLKFISDEYLLIQPKADMQNSPDWHSECLLSHYPLAGLGQGSPVTGNWVIEANKLQVLVVLFGK